MAIVVATVATCQKRLIEFLPSDGINVHLRRDVRSSREDFRGMLKEYPGQIGKGKLCRSSLTNPKELQHYYLFKGSRANPVYRKAEQTIVCARGERFTLNTGEN